LEGSAAGSQRSAGRGRRPSEVTRRGFRIHLQMGPYASICKSLQYM